MRSAMRHYATIFPESFKSETPPSKKNITIRERLKSALYLRLKKRKIFEIVNEGTLSNFRKSSLLQNIEKLEGRPFGDIKFSKKKSHSAEKNSKGGPCSPVRFCILR